MARRKQSILEDLIDLAALLPAWLSLLLAVIFHLTLHQYSLIEIPPGSPLDDPGMFYASLGKAAAGPGQYLVPMIFALGAVVSFFNRRKRQQLVQQTAARSRASALLDMSWQQFEHFVGACFSGQGYSVQQQGGPGPDGGVDLILIRGRETFLVQCKQWRAQQVGVTIVRELYGVMAARGAAGGFVISSGSFTADAAEFASGRNIELIDGKQLLALIGTEPAQTIAKAPYLVPSPVTTPNCPVCANTMVQRTARKGRDKGNVFWGCPAYPRCRGTRPRSH